MVFQLLLFLYLKFVPCLGKGSIEDEVSKLITPKNLKITAGVGFVSPTPVGRFEINFAAPLVGSDSFKGQLIWAMDTDDYS